MSNHFSLKTLIQNFDLQQYIEVNYNFKTAGDVEYRICCPSCGNDKYKLYINIDKRVFNCFTCEFNSRNNDFFDLVALTESISRQQAIQKFALNFKRICPEVIEFSKEEEIKYDTSNDLKVIQFPSGIPYCSNDAGYEYLVGRGLTATEIKACGIRFTDANNFVYNKAGKLVGNLQNRVIFPVYGPPGLVSWQGRHIAPTERMPKYLSAPDTDLSKTLWPFVPPHDNTAIIVEGTIDALAVRRLPKTSAYATFGKKLSTYQIDILRAWGVQNLVIFFDKKDALPQMRSIVERVKTKFNDVLIPDYAKWPEGVDAGKCLEIGIEPIQLALDNKVSTYSLEYTKLILEGNL